MIRDATLADLAALTALEAASFATDRLSRRRFRYFLTTANARTLVALDARGAMQGYVLTLFHKGSALARLYSLAVTPAMRGKGMARVLIAAAETAAQARGCVLMRLEVRADNKTAQRLYHNMGYAAFGAYAHYYDDDEDAVRMQKPLTPLKDGQFLHANYYEQRLKFTCGPASLMVAMQALDRACEVSSLEELRIWREATTIFMTAGHGGCSAHGLALAAHRRGFAVEVFSSPPEVPFIDSVRDAEKKAVMRLVHDDFLSAINARGIPLHARPFTLAELKQRFRDGEIPVVLISSYRFDKEKAPHWVLVTGVDDMFIYLHDPYVDQKAQKTPTDCMHVPVPEKQFMRMARYGRRHLRAALFLKRRREG
ncbi:MAG: GNAT family N-acetyltransferase/peptidase C39 family protein [Pseudomonadota bacterium]